MAFRWRADDGPLIVVFGSFLPHQPKKKKKKKKTYVVKDGPPLTQLSGSAHEHRGNHVLKGATSSIFFPLRVAPVKIEIMSMGIKLRNRQIYTTHYVSFLNRPNIKCFS